MDLRSKLAISVTNFTNFFQNWMDEIGKLVILRLGSFDCISSESKNGPMFKIDHFGYQFHQFLPKLGGKLWKIGHFETRLDGLHFF